MTPAAMSSAHDQPAAPARPPASPPADASRLAHELSNLLDGSMRNVGLALRTLRESTAPGTGHGNGDDAQVVPRLDAARAAMQQMAHLIAHWMSAAHQPQRLFHQRWTLAEMVEHAAGLCFAAARAARATITTNVDPAAAELPAGPLHTVLVNALRNAIEALRRHEGTRRIDVQLQRREAQVTLRIADTGPGFAAALLDDRGQVRVGVTTKPQGHGIGLPLCREIAQSLRGELHLTNTPGGGAVVELTCMVEALRRDEAAI